MCGKFSNGHALIGTLDGTVILREEICTAHPQLEVLIKFLLSHRSLPSTRRILRVVIRGNICRHELWIRNPVRMIWVIFSEFSSVWRRDNLQNEICIAGHRQ
jgi:hypothetical protein